MYVVHENAYDPILFEFLTSKGNQKLSDTVIYGPNAAQAKKSLQLFIMQYSMDKKERSRTSLLAPLSHTLEDHAHHFDNPQDLATSLNSPKMGRIPIDRTQVPNLPKVQGFLGALLSDGSTFGPMLNGAEIDTQMTWIHNKTVNEFLNYALSSGFFKGNGKDILNSCFGMDGIRFGHWLGTSHLLAKRSSNLALGSATKYEQLVDNIYSDYPVVAWCLKDRNVFKSDPAKSITQSNYFGSGSVFEEFNHNGVFISSHLQAKIFMGEVPWDQSVVDQLIQKFMNLRAKHGDWANALVSGAYNALLRLSCQDRQTWVAQFVEFGGHLFFKTYYKANGSSGTPLKFDGKHQYCIDFVDSTGKVSVNGTPNIFYYDNDHVLNVSTGQSFNFKYYSGFDASKQNNPFTNVPGYNDFYGDYSRSVGVVVYNDRFAFGLNGDGSPFVKGVDLVELKNKPTVIDKKTGQPIANPNIWVNSKTRLPSAFKSHVGRGSVYEVKGLYNIPAGVHLKENADEAWELDKIESVLHRLEEKNIGKYNWTNLVNDFIPVEVLNEINSIKSKPYSSLNAQEKAIVDRVNYIEAQTGNLNPPVQGRANTSIVNHTNLTHGQASARLNNTINNSTDPYHQSEASKSKQKIDYKHHNITTKLPMVDNYHGHGVNEHAFENPIQPHTPVPPVAPRQKLASVIKVLNRYLSR